MYLVRVGEVKGGRDWRLEGETSVHVRWGDESRRTCPRFNEPLVWGESLAFDRPHPEPVRIEVVQLSPLGHPEVVARAALPFSKGPFEAAGVRGEMLTVMDGALRQLLRLTEENRELRGRAAVR